MKILLLLRHAKSSWKHPDLSDHDRPLNKRGLRDAPRVGKWLKKQDLVPEYILSSSARRARETAIAVATASDCHGEIDLLPSLYQCDQDDFTEAISRLPDEIEIALVIGHNPELEELLAHLTCEITPLPTAALAQISLPIDRWCEFDDHCEGQLQAVWLPRENP